MPAKSKPSFDIPESVLLRWMMKAFLVGLFAGAGAAIYALVGR
ncbi:MAG TPA: hypothetical protein VGV38_00430 [Pyrinomonadaceae bacterium]|nr:hypothetical protein [Pyrinomonadaceae bacterium]